LSSSQEEMDQSGVILQPSSHIIAFEQDNLALSP